MGRARPPRADSLHAASRAGARGAAEPEPGRITDVPGVRVGQWSSRRRATGVSVVLAPPGTVGGVDVRGGAPGTRETDLLRPGMLVEEVHAVLLAGGSAPGLAAADGVVRALRGRGVGYAVGPPGTEQRIPIVPGAILYDLGIGRPWSPDAEAGYRAARAASGGRVAEGSVGAGTGATVAKLAGADGRLKGGIGTASERLAAAPEGGDREIVVGALVVVNALGAIVDPASGEPVAAPRGPRRTFLDPIELLRAGGPARGTPPAPESTTLAVVATDAKLTKAEASVLAAAAHDGFARTIWPAHTRGDGDVAFGLATGAVELAAGRLVALEALAARAVERAVLRAVRLATGLAGVPSAAEWRARRPRAARSPRAGR